MKTRRWQVWFLALVVVSASCSGKGKDEGGSGKAADTQATPIAETRSAKDSTLTAAAEAEALQLDDPTRREQLARYLEFKYSTIEGAAREQPRDMYDPRAVAASVGGNSRQLLTWVRENTFWVPYQGSLRGPVGVLMDRLGNSLDRALLLGELLRVSGHNVRLARASLTASQVTELLAKVRSVPTQRRRETVKKATVPATQLPPDLQWVADQVRKTREEGRRASERHYDEMVQRVSEQAPALVTVAGQATDSAAAIDILRSAMRDHWWVQIQENGSWVGLDPLAAEMGAGDRLQEAEITVPLDEDGSFQLDAAQRHELVIRVIVERWNDTGLSEHVVLEQAIFPSDVIGQPMSVYHVGNAWSQNWSGNQEKTSGVSFYESALDQREWLPVLNVGLRRAVASMKFTADGEISSSSLLGPTQRATGGIADVFAGDEMSASGHLTAEWIEYEIRTPGASPRKQRHEIFDVLGPAARSTGQRQALNISDEQRLKRAGALAGATEILPLVSEIPVVFLSEVTSVELLASRQKWIDALRTEDPGQQRKLLSAAQDPTSAMQALYGYAIARRHLSPVQNLVFQDSIGLANLRSYVDFDERGNPGYRALIDLVANNIAALPGGSQSIFSVAMQQGVADTAAEHALLGPSVGKENVTTIFSIATSRGIDTIVVRDRSDARWRKLEVASDVRTRVEQDLTDGNIVVLPNGTVENRIGWWRVDAGTGSTVGVMDSGFRSDLVEYEDTSPGVQSQAVTARRPNPMYNNPRKVLKDMGVPDDHPQYMEMIDDVITLQEKLMKAKKDFAIVLE